MVLKSLILQGFKSFPDRTEIKFLGGMTAIVGPNGSGKSNISDAIRWVLGEQSSRSLRGAKMEDVIFGGTAKRGPVGFAEVSLILDNSTGVFRSPFAEIMVTRRYYRSGESEYSLGKKHCRLRDIRELFMDTGLGLDGYSSIGQGRIDEILSLRSEDRRGVFEEAAGITKFRARKEEAERRLAATEDNLTRIRDLYDELGRQLEPLEKQAKKTEKFLVLRDELRVLEVSLWLEQLERLKSEAEKRSRDAEVCRGQLENAKSEQERRYQQAEQLTADLHGIDRETEALRTSLREAESREAGQASRIAVLRANLENCRANLERVHRENEERAKQAEKLAEQFSAQETRIAELEQSSAEARERLAAQEDRLAQHREAEGAAAAALERAEQARAAAQNEQHTLALERTAAQTGLAGMDGQQDDLHRALENAGDRLKAVQEEQSAFESRVSAGQTTLRQAQAQAGEADAALRQAKADADALGTALRQAESALTDARNRAAMLRDMQRDYDGFARSVRSVMQQAGRGRLSGVHGPVSALLSTENRFVTAIDTALGASASSIVVGSAEDGRACIEYLRRTDGGRATFLPLDTIRPASLRESGLDRERGCCGTADTLVQFDETYGAVVRSLLARTVVCENMDAALALARSHGHRFRIVTLDGQIIQPGGAMTGGSASRGTGALARAGRLRAAEEQAERCEAARKTAEQRFRAAEKRLHACETACETQNAALRRQAEAQAALAAACTQHRALLGNAQARQEELMQQQRSMEAEKQRSAEVLASFDAREAQAGTQLRDAETRVQTCRDALARLRTEAAEQEAQLAGQRTALTRTEAELSGENRALEQMRALRCETDAGLSSAADSIKRYECECERMQDELAEEKAAHERSETLTRTLREQLEQTGKRREQVEERRTAVRRDAQDAGEQILGMEREASRLENRAGQLKAEEAQLLGRMWESYELTPTPAAALAQPLDDPAAARERAHELRGEIRALGSVNPDAVEEYRRVRERYAFMGGQKDDLERAQRELYRVIDRLTVNMKEIFASEFARLNVLFGQTFREIFGGGHAELALADTSDILSCGIDIRVSPPGKAVKTITLLSGGEKAFVAITLYFAILKLRPAPFCVLDEIEAALDDVNVQRYAKYIRKLTDFTQFIVITHRRGTMEEADMLYGVTMQEQGVSKLLMLNLAEAEKRLKNTIK
ncbi:chromosome segregation protein SMC [Agathobaculum hominis]|uniref:Chromosome partition protein Smc n=1 Tax=Agathobaculum hominis TaxID=2763014 RepID=A0ABR7GKS4_9FIRM|nr:chromosome segregation protein SMC [Agathobaculum hominis]MBC5694893.1 chromosome segregation protein SMC [Agathobaculum hominis]